MAYKCYFMDSETYSADDINQIFARLTSQGVSLYNDTGSPLVDINTAISNVTSEGVTTDGNSCKVIIKDGEYVISKGTAIMSDGSMIMFDDEGYALNVVTGSTQYVYLIRSLGTNTINAIVSETTQEDALLLAQINEDGTITDKRTFSKSKFQFPVSTNYKTFENLTMMVNYYDTAPVALQEPYSGNVLNIEGDYNYFSVIDENGTESLGHLTPESNVMIKTTHSTLYFSKSGTEVAISGFQKANKFPVEETITLSFM